MPEDSHLELQLMVAGVVGRRGHPAPAHVEAGSVSVAENVIDRCESKLHTVGVSNESQGMLKIHYIRNSPDNFHKTRIYWAHAFIHYVHEFTLSSLYSKFSPYVKSAD